MSHLKKTRSDDQEKIIINNGQKRMKRNLSEGRKKTDRRFNSFIVNVWAGRNFCKYGFHKSRDIFRCSVATSFFITGSSRDENGLVNITENVFLYILECSRMPNEHNICKISEQRKRPCRYNLCRLNMFAGLPALAYKINFRCPPRFSS